jgi:DNA-binding HxlR family transcriptional regulator
LFRKGVKEVIIYLWRSKEAGYYELYKQGFVVSRYAFAKILKELEEKGIVRRILVDSRPPRVKYGLTSKGVKIAEILYKLDEIMK